MKSLAFLISVCLVGFVGPAESTGAACEPISIFAAASTTDVLEQIAADYERDTACSVSTIFAGSGTLARQIEAGAPADIYLSASTEWMDWVERTGLVRQGNRVPLLANQLVIIVPKEHAETPINIQQRGNLANYLGTEKLAIGDPSTVPAGRYAATALRHFGVKGLGDDQIVRASSVRAAVAWVARGEAKAGIVYRTDASIDDRVRIAGTIPAIQGNDIIYPLALVGRTPNDAARSFFEYLQSYSAASVFADNGFSRVSGQ